MKTDTPVAAPAAPQPINKHRTLFMTVPNGVDVTAPSGACYPTVASTYGIGSYKGTIEEAIAQANTQSAAAQKAGAAGIVYVLGVVAIVRPKAPIELPTIVERFDLPSAK